MPQALTQLVFATNNPHKLQEVRAMLGRGFELLSLADIGFTQEIPEDFDTLERNAAQKAWHIHSRYRVHCFADDTGLEVEALGGAPGALSALYAGPHRSAHDNMSKLLAALRGQPNRRARFRTVIALVMGGREHRFEGVVEGAIAQAPAGAMGFGYDPIFIPHGHSQTFAQMALESKNSMSHRARALAKLIEFLRGE